MAKFEPQRTTINSLLKPELVFFGTGHISLRALETAASSFMIEAVITKSSRGAHNSQSSSATEDWAEEHGIDCYHADTKQQLKDLFSTKNFRAQMGLVVDYGVIIPAEVIEYFPLGIINSHFSLLPKYRGADPIRAAIINRDDKTGVSLMRITPQLDDGPVIARSEVMLDQTETASDLTQKLLQSQDKLLATSLVDYHAGKIEPVEQNHEDASFTAKLTKSDGEIDWSEPAATIEAKIRAHMTWPRSRTKINGNDVIIIGAETTDRPPASIPGTAHIAEQQLFIDCADSQLQITSLQPAGKAKMSAKNFINGYLKTTS